MLTSFIPKMEVSKSAFESQLGTVLEMLKKHVGPKLHETLNDDAKLKAAAQTIHKFLPMPIRIALSEEKFSDLVVSHKAPLIAALA